MSKEERIKRSAGKGQILILTNKLDIGADWVVRELQERQATFLRLNTEDLPNAQVSWHGNGEWSIKTEVGRTCDSASLAAVWFRRPGRPFGERVLQDSPAALLNAQWRSFLDGALVEKPGIRWLNHPVSISRAESKMWQLTVAQRVGFNVPETVVTNSAELATSLAARWRTGAVVKALDAPLVVVGGQERFVFTTKMEASHVSDSKAFATAPVIVQRRLEPRRDIRVTVVGERSFAAEASQGTQQDWRLEQQSIEFRPRRLTPSVTSSCVELVKQLGLRYGAIDLAESVGRMYFLELNPNGEWGWLQAGGIPIASAIADELIGPN